jgi:regulator of protease activity HflC (stomatin/prohibitin superfamily)
MEPAAWIASLVGVVIILSVVGWILLETSIRVEPGTLALLLKRGATTTRALAPGRHFIQPWRKVMVQIYPSRELALVAGGSGSGDPRVDATDATLRVHLGDKTFAEVSYTVRCQLDPAKLSLVHDQFGPEGIWSALRDTTRRTLIAEASNGDVSADDVFGDEFIALERRFSEALEAALGEIGFALTMFSLREIDLGETGEVIQSTLRTEVELEREQALARVRAARLENDAALRDLLGDVDDDVMLRYRQIEAWRDLLQRWDGDRPIPSALTAPLTAPPAMTGDAERQHAIQVDEVQQETAAANELP